MADEEPRGFLGRWSRRKADALQGKPLVEPVPAVPVPAATAPLTVPPVHGAPAPAAAPDAAEPAKVLSLDDVKLLTKDSDFKPFMAGNVGPAVRNAAMKKLFADPHFNIMDGLDIYIDDYSKPDPIPEAMLWQMNGSMFLNLFADEVNVEAGKNPGTASPRENANDAAGQTVAQSTDHPDISRPDLPPSDHSSQPEPSPGSGASQEDHADTDLRLQPDHAAPAPDAGRGT
ncbi:MAG: DUF3306 domain-containing protein [Hydrogenophaga sp.]|nr:DUF3306 domain-containing protein [Hydrogenophaga sp.]